MIRIDGFYLYSSGYSIHPLSDLAADVPVQDWLLRLYIAQNAVETFLQKSIFRPQISQVAGKKLLDAIKMLTVNPDRQDNITLYEAYLIKTALDEFEHVLAADLGMMNIWLVLKKRGYDTTDLIEQGWVLFPPELGIKVPESLIDIHSATKCIAYELPTAAGFHLHRANESVLHRYYDAVTKGAPRPTSRNIGDYLKEFRDKKVGDEKILSALRDLKDLHRNPLIHPEDSLTDIDEAIALLGSIQAVVNLMLKAIPAPPESDKQLSQAASSGLLPDTNQ